MSHISAFIVAIFSLLFFLIGAWFQASGWEAAYITLFVVVLVIGFSVKVTRIDRILIYVAVKNSGPSSQLILVLIVSILAVLYLIVFSNLPIPILSQDIERDRMIPVVEYGVVYRVMNALIFFAIPVIVYSMHRKTMSNIIGSVALLALFVLLLSLGFRSRLVDFIMIYGLSIILLNKVYRGYLFKATLYQCIKVAIAFVGVFFLLIALTAYREGADDMWSALESVVDRSLFLNYRVNFWRIYAFVELEGFQIGRTYFTDFLSLIGLHEDSMQMMVTKYFNQVNSDLFTMTPTVFGEFYLNFGWLSVLFVFPLALVYRHISEKVIIKLSLLPYANIVAFSYIVNYMYSIPRVVVTGGFSNAFLLVNITLLITFCMIYAVMLVVNAIIPKRGSGTANL